MIKPKALKPGDKIAALTSSFGGPGLFPHRYEAGKRQLEDAFQIKVVELEHTLAAPDFLQKHPQARADDFTRALTDPSIDGIVVTIGGDDSIRLLPYLDRTLIAKHPKVFLGYSDTTVSHFMYFKAGVISFYGPSILSGFGENGGLHRYLVDGVRRTIFSTEIPEEIRPNGDGWTEEFLDWVVPAHQTQRRTLNPSAGWNWLQGEGVVSGALLGGCLEVVSWLRGTELWPTIKEWRDKILFLETSEEGMSAGMVARELRTLGALGLFDSVSGVLFGRPGGRIPVDKHKEYDDAVLRIIRDELGRSDLPIVTQMDFGHTDPIMTLPIGVCAELDCDNRRFSLLESAVS